ncbi:IPI1 [Scenedesmus sp. PABB004]|nr:IPI1 [Scenedesmus sp. PABB004]
MLGARLGQLPARLRPAAARGGGAPTGRPAPRVAAARATAAAAQPPSCARSADGARADGACGGVHAAKRARLEPPLARLYAPGAPLGPPPPPGGGAEAGLAELEHFLGHRFARPELLAQACTFVHSADKATASYRQLAFLGDAALWLVFAEHAVTRGAHEHPGAWPARLSALLSRASCAATARAWGLQRHARAGRGGGGSSGSSSVSCCSTTSSGSGSSSSGSGSSSSGSSSTSSSSTSSSGSSTSGSGMYRGAWRSDVLAEMLEAVAGALLLDAGFATLQRVLAPWVAASFGAPAAEAVADAAPRRAAADASAALDPDGPAQAALAEVLRSALAARVLQFAAAARAHGGAPLDGWGPLDGAGAGASWPAVAAAAAGGGGMAPDGAGAGAWGAWDDTAAAAAVEGMCRRKVSLSTVRHRAKMWLGLGLDPAPWVGPGAHVLRVRWKHQKGSLARCLDLLVAAVWLDGGGGDARRVAARLLAATPPTGTRAAPSRLLRSSLAGSSGAALAAAMAAPKQLSTWQSRGSQQDFMQRDCCILVDEADRVTGAANKYDSHRFVAGQPQGLLHRAFSVFLFNSQGKLLLQQRAADKITFPGVWTNTCCSHQLAGQDPEEQDSDAAIADGSVPGAKAAAVRKLAHELGIAPGALPAERFKFLTRLHYCAPDTATHGPAAEWGEHEIDYILLVQADVDVTPNPEEVAAVRHVDLAELQAMMAPGSGLAWSPWFRIIAQHWLPTWWADLPATLGSDAHVDTGTVHRLSC